MSLRAGAGHPSSRSPRPPRAACHRRRRPSTPITIRPTTAAERSEYAHGRPIIGVSFSQRVQAFETNGLDGERLRSRPAGCRREDAHSESEPPLAPVEPIPAWRANPPVSRSGKPLAGLTHPDKTPTRDKLLAGAMSPNHPVEFIQPPLSGMMQGKNENPPSPPAPARTPETGRIGPIAMTESASSRPPTPSDTTLPFRVPWPPHRHLHRRQHPPPAPRSIRAPQSRCTHPATAPSARLTANDCMPQCIYSVRLVTVHGLSESRGGKVGELEWTLSRSVGRI